MKAFHNVVPDAWSVDTPSQGADYGIDATVELFDDDGDAGGLGFYVQVKATAEPDLAKALAYSFKTETLDYYGRLERPVLLVRYHAPTESLFAAWWHRMDDGRRNIGQKTKTLKWEEVDRWTERRSTMIALDVERYRAATRTAVARPVEATVVLLEGHGLPEDRIRALQRAIRSYPREHIVYSGLFEVDGPYADGALVRVEIDGVWATVDYGGVSITQANLPGRLDTREEVRSLVDTITCLVGVCAGAAGHSSLGAEIVSTYVGGASIWSSPDFAPAAVDTLDRGGMRAEAYAYIHRLYDVMRDPELPEAARSVLLWGVSLATTNLRISAREGQRDIVEIQSVLEREVEARSSGDGDPLLGGALYSLANHLYTYDGSLEATRDAVTYYSRARKHEPAYCSRPYFARELAGALFGVSRFAAAAEWYARAIELGDDEDETRACWGDALLSCGQFDRASRAMEPWADIDERPLWWLKHRTAVLLRDTWGDAVERRQSDAAEMEWDSTRDTLGRLAEAQARRALDPLNAAAAFNEGCALSEVGQWAAAMDRFLLCAALCPSDAESWRNAMLSALNRKPPEGDLVLPIAIGRAGVVACGQEFLEAVETAIDEHPEPAARDAIDGLLSLLRDMVLDPVSTFTIRYFDGTASGSSVLVGQRHVEANQRP